MFISRIICLHLYSFHAKLVMAANKSDQELQSVTDK